MTEYRLKRYVLRSFVDAIVWDGSQECRDFLLGLHERFEWRVTRSSCDLFLYDTPVPVGSKVYRHQDGGPAFMSPEEFDRHYVGREELCLEKPSSSDSRSERGSSSPGSSSPAQ